MSNDVHKAKTHGQGDYERRDIGVAGVLYFILALLIAGGVVHFIVHGLYGYLEGRSETRQTPISPLIANAPKDTRRLPPEYKTDSESADYEKYLQKNFPTPQLETNERTELNKIRLREENILSTYGWVDQNAGTVHIPIDRAMDLVAERGLPVRQPSPGQGSDQQNKKGSQQ